MRARLLIAEDNALNRDLLVQLFEDAYDLELAGDGFSAVSAAATRPPDLILMDIEMPRMGGLDAVRAIRRRDREVPIIAISAHVMPGDRERAIEAGCDDFVAKPIDDLRLIAIVARCLERG
jgi:two-component system, cell cycle response regulator DivK